MNLNNNIIESKPVTSTLKDDVKALVNLITYGRENKPKQNITKDISALFTMSQNGNTISWTEHTVDTDDIFSYRSLSFLANYNSFYVNQNSNDGLRIYVNPQQFTANGVVETWYHRINIITESIVPGNPIYVDPQDIAEFPGVDTNGNTLEPNRLYYSQGTIIYFSDIIELNEAIINVSDCSFDYNFQQFRVFEDKRLYLNTRNPEINTYNRAEEEYLRSLGAVNIALNPQAGTAIRFPYVRKSLKIDDEEHFDYIMEFRYEDEIQYRAPGDSEDWAIKLKFNSFEGLVAFTDIFYFSNSPFKYIHCVGFPSKGMFLREFNSLLDQYLFKVRGDKNVIMELHIYRLLSEETLAQQDPIYLWDIMGQVLESRVFHVREQVALKLLDAIRQNELRPINATQFLSKLLSKKTSKKQSYFYRLFNQLDDSFFSDEDNFSEFNNTIKFIWKQSDYANPNYEIYQNTNQQGEEQFNGPLLLPYKSDKILGFYQSNVDIDWVDNYNILKVTLGTGEYTVVPGGYMSSGTAIEKTIDYHYHPLQPLYIKDVNNQQSASSDIQFESIIPASYLKAIDVKNSLANYLTAGEYVIDVLTTVSGVGNLLKLRHITKLSKLDKAIKLARQGVAVIEITSGSINALLKLTGLADKQYGETLSEYLFYLEMLALSVDVTDWINKGLKRSATKLLDNQKFVDDLDALKKNAKNADEAKQVDEVIEHLEEVARTKIELNNLSTLGKQGNKVVHILTDEAGNVIGELIRTSKSKRKISFKLKDVEFVNFSSKNSTLNLNSEITLLDTQLAKSPDYGLTVNKGEEILYGDLNIPKDITDELSGLGDLMLQDALLYFKNNKTFNKS